MYVGTPFLSWTVFMSFSTSIMLIGAGFCFCDDLVSLIGSAEPLNTVGGIGGGGGGGGGGAPAVGTHLFELDSETGGNGRDTSGKGDGGLPPLTAPTAA